MKNHYIYKRRIELELTLEQVAAAVGVSAATVSRWESGDIANMRTDKIEKLAKVLKTSPLQIIGLSNDNDTSLASSGETAGAYYDNPETAKMAQQIFENKELRVLFDAAKDVSPETLKKVHDILLVLKRSEQGDDSGC